MQFFCKILQDMCGVLVSEPKNHIPTAVVAYYVNLKDHIKAPKSSLEHDFWVKNKATPTNIGIALLFTIFFR